MRYRDGLTTTLAGVAISVWLYARRLAIYFFVAEHHGLPHLWDIALFFAGVSPLPTPCCASWYAMEMSQWSTGTGLAAVRSSQRVSFKGRPSALAVATAAVTARLAAFIPWFIGTVYGHDRLSLWRCDPRGARDSEAQRRRSAVR